MPYTEFCSYLSGIMPDTPLGNIVSIRSENDKEVIDSFTPEQRKIRNEWLERQASHKTEEETKKVLDSILQEFKRMAEGGM